jgi:hypothetical protein
MTIHIIPFKFKHLQALIDLHASQQSPTATHISMKTLPKVGYIAYLGNQPIAAGFLRRVEPCYAQIDTLVSNAHFGSKIRHEGISQVVDALIIDAKALKLKGLIAHTLDTGTITRAKSLGFHVVPQTILALPL